MAFQPCSRWCWCGRQSPWRLVVPILWRALGIARDRSVGVMVIYMGFTWSYMRDLWFIWDLWDLYGDWWFIFVYVGFESDFMIYMGWMWDLWFLWGLDYLRGVDMWFWNLSGSQIFQGISMQFSIWMNSITSCLHRAFLWSESKGSASNSFT